MTQLWVHQYTYFVSENVNFFIHRKKKNHRTAWLGKDHEDHLVSASLPCAGPGCSKSHPTLNISRDGNLLIFHWATYSNASSPLWVKKFLLISKLNLPSFNLKSFALVSSGHAKSRSPIKVGWINNLHFQVLFILEMETRFAMHLLKMRLFFLCDFKPMHKGMNINNLTRSLSFSSCLVKSLCLTECTMTLETKGPVCYQVLTVRQQKKQ